MYFLQIAIVFTLHWQITIGKIFRNPLPLIYIIKNSTLGKENLDRLICVWDVSVWTGLGPSRLWAPGEPTKPGPSEWPHWTWGKGQPGYGCPPSLPPALLFYLSHWGLWSVCIILEYDMSSFFQIHFFFPCRYQIISTTFIKKIIHSPSMLQGHLCH